MQPAPPRFPGFPPGVLPRPELLHQLEARDPDWAPEMETSLAKTWLSPELFARLGLEEMNITEVSCRQTTCLLRYEYPARLERLVAAAGLQPGSPMVLVEEALGWASPRAGGLTTTVADRNGEPVKMVSLVLGFDEESWDPATYAGWVSRQRPLAQEFYRRARAARVQRTLPHPGELDSDAG